MSDHEDFDFEPIPGLPALPPAGEALLWQGRPATLALAREAFGLNWVIFYFAAIVLWRASVGWGIGGFPAAVVHGLPFVALGLVGCALVVLMAYAQARATVYTITTARVAMRIGAALSVTFNLPFTQIGSANLALGKDGTGTIALETLGDTRLAYMVLWPHARPWQFRKTQPALRAIPDAARVAQILADAAETRMAQPIIGRAGGGLSAVLAE